jgi:hypothetical protein
VQGDGAQQHRLPAPLGPHVPAHDRERQQDQHGRGDEREQRPRQPSGKPAEEHRGKEGAVGNVIPRQAHGAGQDQDEEDAHPHDRRGKGGRQSIQPAHRSGPSGLRLRERDSRLL